MDPRAKWTATVLIGLLAIGLAAGRWLGTREPRALDLAGRSVDPLGESGVRATVLLFVRSDCPIANRYAPEIGRIYEDFARQDVSFWLVYPDPDETPETIRRHLQAYSFPDRALRDPDHVLVGLAGATITPEVAVFNPEKAMIYRGRIDDRYAALGRARPAPTRRDLKDMLDALIAGGTPRSRTTKAVGCLIADLK